MTSTIAIYDLLPQDSLEIIALEEQNRLKGGFFNSSTSLDQSTNFTSTATQRVERNGSGFNVSGDVNFINLPPDILAGLAASIAAGATA